MPPVQFFHTCLVNEFAPQVGFAVVGILERLGYDVQVPLTQTCCGQPALNAGFQDHARVAARHTITLLEMTQGAIVIPSGSCGDMLIHQYDGLFAADQAWKARAGAIAMRCHELSAFVASHMDATRASPLVLRGHAQTTVAYHPSCHLLRGLGVDVEPKSLIDAIPGVTRRVVTAEDECCGFGGLFSVKHPEISTRMLERKMDNVLASGAERLVSCDLGCLLHVGGGLHRRGASIKVQHLAEILDEASS